MGWSIGAKRNQEDEKIYYGLAKLVLTYDKFDQFLETIQCHIEYWEKGKYKLRHYNLMKKKPGLAQKTISGKAIL